MTLELTDQRTDPCSTASTVHAAAVAMKILAAFPRPSARARLLDIAGAHIDGCLYHGKASLDFVERLVERRRQGAVPTTLNVGSIDLIHPGSC